MCEADERKELLTIIGVGITRDQLAGRTRITDTGNTCYLQGRASAPPTSEDRGLGLVGEAWRAALSWQRGRPVAVPVGPGGVPPRPATPKLC